MEGIERLWTDKEAAEYLGLSAKTGYQTLQKWVRMGLLKSGRVGDHYRFRKEDLDEFVFSKK
jgi:excisionase family DNA binding protein